MTNNESVGLPSSVPPAPETKRICDYWNLHEKIADEASCQQCGHLAKWHWFTFVDYESVVADPKEDPSSYQETPIIGICDSGKGISPHDYKTDRKSFERLECSCREFKPSTNSSSSSSTTQRS
jgi:hypothetical protein